MSSDNQQQLQELRRFAEFGRLSATMIHEISNPLSAALLELELSDNASPSVRKAKRNMQVLRLYVEAARQQISGTGKTRNFVVQSQFDQLKIILSPLAKQAGVSLVFRPASKNCKLYGDPVKFQQILANLIMNAVQAYGPADAYKPSSLVKVSLFDDNGGIVIQVHDWGKGIPPDEMPKLFEPFYTTKGERNQGLGLGLATVKQFVTMDFGGSIKVTSQPGRGTQFTVKMGG